MIEVCLALVTVLPRCLEKPPFPLRYSYELRSLDLQERLLALLASAVEIHFVDEIEASLRRANA